MTTWLDRQRDRLAQTTFPNGHKDDDTCGCGQPKKRGTLTCASCRELNRHNAHHAGFGHRSHPTEAAS